MKIGIIGTGNVGSTVAYTLILENLVTDLVLIDTREEFAHAETLELKDTAKALSRTINFTKNDYAAIADADIVIFSASPAAHMASSNRLEELPMVKKIVEDVADKLKTCGFGGVIISITNPCDVVAWYLQRQTGFDPQRVIGSGAVIDTARLRDRANHDECLIIGEHGDSQVAVGEVSPQAQEAARSTGWEVYSAKGYTNFAIAACVGKIVKAIAGITSDELSVSSYDEEAEAYYSVPTKLGKSGVVSRNIPPLTDAERIELDKSIATIKEAFAQL